LNPLNWAAQPPQKLAQLVGPRNYFWSHFSGNVGQIMSHFFPNIGLEPSMFSNYGKWRLAEQRKNFFEKYARENNFDASSAESWYKHVRKINKHKAANSVTQYHGHSAARALVELFPNVKFDKSRF